MTLYSALEQAPIRAETAAALLERHIARSQADEIIVTTNTFDPVERAASFTRLAAVAWIGRPRTPATQRV